jgi:hypothetical protein
MANIPFNIQLGRAVESYRRVKENDPASSVLQVMVLLVSGVGGDGSLRDLDTIGSVLSTANEASNTGYTRKTLSDADLAAFAPDDVNDRTDIDIPDLTWTGVASGGTGSSAWNDIVISFDKLGSGSDPTIIPISLHDFVVTPDGSDITAQIAATGFYRAQPL